MDQKLVEQRIAELRVEYPKMFSHPRAKPDEICLGVTPHATNGRVLHARGLASIRLEDEDGSEVSVDEAAADFDPLHLKGKHWTMFGNLEEFIKKEQDLYNQ